MRIFLAAVLLAGAAWAQDAATDAFRALNDGRTEEAIALLEPLREANPDDGRVRLALAQGYRLSDRTADAELELEAVSRLAEDEPLLFRGLSVYYEQDDEAGKAARAEAQYAKAFPDDVTAFGRAATFFLDAGEYERTISFARAGLALGPSAALYDILGKAQAELGLIDEAEQAFRAVTDLQPYDEDGHYNLAYLFLQAHRYEQALEAFTDAERFFDKSARIQLGIGTTQYALRKFDAALDAYLRASRFAPGAPQPHYFLGRMLEHLPARAPEILARQEAFAKRMPEDYLATFLHAEALLASLAPSAEDGDLEQAKTLLHQSIEARTDFWESHFELGRLLSREGNYTAATKELERAVELNPKASKPHYHLARAYARLGENEKATAARAEHERLTEEERKAMTGGMGAPLTGTTPAPQPAASPLP